MDYLSTLPMGIRVSLRFGLSSAVMFHGRALTD